METPERIRQFIIANFYGADPSTLRNDTSLLDNGIIDSTGVLEIVAFLADELGVEVGEGEMIAANLDSINNIVKFVERKSRQPEALRSSG